MLIYFNINFFCFYFILHTRKYSVTIRIYCTLVLLILLLYNKHIYPVEKNYFTFSLITLKMCLSKLIIHFYEILSIRGSRDVNRLRTLPDLCQPRKSQLFILGQPSTIRNYQFVVRNTHYHTPRPSHVVFVPKNLNLFFQ